MQKVVFIINPNSAKKNYQSFLKQLKTKVSHPNYYISESVEGTFDFIDQNFESTDIFVAFGGDGTISTIAQKLINTEKALAIFPAGSGNGFSNETQFSKNIDLLLKKIESHKTQKIDTFTVNGLLSINVSGAGFDGAVVEAFEKTSRGFSNYIKVSVKTFFNYKPISIQFEDRYKKYNGRYLMINIANTRQFGNHAYIAPNASLTDGLAEIVLVKKFPFFHSPVFAYRMFTKKLIPNRYLQYLSVREITFSVDTEQWHLDGEFNRIESPIYVKILPKSLKILV